ncbi:MAG: ribose 5-phosphate isomerase B [Tenericutes bacterium HGW-Tenericutes-8]|nr:MAG: ribose 5-phosphate isomerase B [Tenericutes bacterium HGW-Tenericutes-8]
MIAIGSDHGGYELKEGLIAYFKENKIPYQDFGTDGNASVDYPDYGIKVGEAVAKGKYEFGIVICGTGIGISISANKVKGIRCALIYDITTATLAKQHNNANVIALGGRTTTLANAIKMVETFRNETYELRHQKRLDKMSAYEEACHE